MIVGEFHEILKKTREEKGIHIEEAASAVNISVDAYKNIESGSTPPTINTVTSLAEFLDISIDYLVGRSRSKTVYKKWSETELEQEKLSEIVQRAGVLSEFIHEARKGIFVTEDDLEAKE